MKIVRKARYHLRFKYRKGHNIHSPFVYNLVRGVFMPKPSTTLPVDERLYSELIGLHQKPQRVVRWCHLYSYLGCSTYAINPKRYNGEELIVITSMSLVGSIPALIEEIVKSEKRVGIVINGINKNSETRGCWNDIISNVVLDFHSFGVVVVDKLLNAKKYKLKI